MNVRIAVGGIALAGLLWTVGGAEAQTAPPASRPSPAGVGPTGSAPANAPRLKLSTNVWDFGTKWYGEPCSTEVTISNIGNAPLEILRVRRSCGCTVAQPQKRKLAPGESVSMKITYNTRKNRKNVSQTITLETNDPTQPRVPIRIKGVVQHLFDAKPGNRVVFGRLERESDVKQVIELHNNMKEPVYLKLKAGCETGPFDVKFETIEDGVAYRLTVATRPPLKIGANVAEVELETGLERFPTMLIPISAYVAPRVAVMPTRLFVTPKITRSFQRLIRVTYRPEKPIRITRITTSHPDLIKAELVEPQKPERVRTITKFYQIRVTLPPGKDMPPEGGWIDIETSDPSPEYRKFRVEVVMRKPAARQIVPDLRHAVRGHATSRPAPVPETGGGVRVAPGKKPAGSPQ